MSRFKNWWRPFNSSTANYIGNGQAFMTHPGRRCLIGRYYYIIKNLLWWLLWIYRLYFSNSQFTRATYIIVVVLLVLISGYSDTRSFIMGWCIYKKGPKIQNLLFALSAFGRQHSHRHAYLFLREFNAAYQFLSFFSSFIKRYSILYNGNNRSSSKGSPSSNIWLRR